MRGTRLVSEPPAPEVAVIVLSYEEDRSAAHRAGHGVAKEAFFHHEHAGSARAANEFVAGEEHGVFCDEGLHQTGRNANKGVPAVLVPQTNGSRQKNQTRDKSHPTLGEEDRARRNTRRGRFESTP